jgi:Ca-activated chloride channel family protein
MGPMSQQLVAAAAVMAGMMGNGPQEPQAVFSARAELVVLHVRVNDRAGHDVAGLTADRFTVQEDDRRQDIQFFASQDAPVTIGLIVDSSGSMRTLREPVLAAVDAFVATSNPQDQLFALAYNEGVRAALPADAPFTSDPVTMRAALAVAISARGRTALYDAVSAALRDANTGAYPRKALVVVSDGGDNASTTTFAEVLRETQISNTQIYTVALSDPLDRDANPKRLRQLADASGGDAFEPEDTSRISDVLRQIARDIRNTYTIGYVPTNTARNGRFRRVRVEARAADGRKLSVRTREGYAVADR